MTRTKLLLVLACLCAAAVAAQPAQARKKYANYYTKFEISIQGQLSERWAKDVNHGAGYGCPAREEASGGTTIKFATEKPFQLTAGVYGGWHGRPPVKIVEDRYGQSRTANADGSAADCGQLRPSYDGSACGHREYSARLTLFKEPEFGFNFPADDPLYPFECPYPPKPPTWGSDDYWDTGYVIGRYDSGVDWMRGLFGKRPRRNFTIHNVKHVSLPYGTPGSPGAFEGQYEADIDWTAKIHRLEKAHTGR